LFFIVSNLIVKVVSWVLIKHFQVSPSSDLSNILISSISKTLKRSSKVKRRSNKKDKKLEHVALTVV
jgi:hypothetical protein